MTPVVEIGKSFRAMNTDVNVVVCAPPAQLLDASHALDEVKSLFDQSEATLSRFISGNELWLLNQAGGQPFQASTLLFQVVDASLRAAEVTDGLFDPTILSRLVAAGYARSFEEPTATIQDARLLAAHPCSWRDVRLNTETLTIHMTAGCGLDLGGIGKGWIADLASRILQGFSGFALDAGGDIVVGGSQADGLPWTIGVASPWSKDQDLTELETTHGAICTSSTLRRTWSTHGMQRHHIIDPRTGESAASGVVAATVTAESAARAEIIAKVCIILGPTEGMNFIERQGGSEGLLVLENGKFVCSAGFGGRCHVA